MITAFRFRVSGAASLVVLVALITGACQKVPLLAPTGSTITLTASATALPLGGSTTLIVQVVEAAGTPPHQGTHVIFTTTLGTVQPSEAQTDINGRVTATFSAGNASGTATITATSGAASGGGSTTGTTTVAASNIVKIALGAAAVGSVAVTANPGTVPSIGGSSTIIATVLDAGGNLLTGVPVTFTTDAGSVSPTLVATDVNGRAQTTLTTTAEAKVTATAGVGTTGTTPTGAPSATVTVKVNTGTTITVGAPSPTAPTVGQLVTFGVTRTAGAPIQRTSVSYGDGSTDIFNGLPSSVSHRYSTPGGYTVRVSALDTFGDTWIGLSSVTVAPRPQVTVDVTPPATAPAAGKAAVIGITATPTPGAAIQKMVITWGDPTPDTVIFGNAKSVQHTYAAAGNYSVGVTATDSSDATGTGATVISVVP